jgi:hypothetical protein
MCRRIRHASRVEQGDGLRLRQAHAEAGRVIRDGDCVRLPDGRVARVRSKAGTSYKVRVRRWTSNTHQFLVVEGTDLEPIACPEGWMSPEGYRRYLRVTLAKMRKRRTARRSSR